MSSYIRILMDGDWGSNLSSAVKASILDSVGTISLPKELINMPGMSGLCYRTFISKLISKIDNPRYLEIGSWKGSTASSAMLNNELTITCIDNWSEFGGSKEEFISNTNKFKGVNELTLIESDFREVDYSSIGLYNVYLFDGPHEESDQYDGVLVAQEALESEYVLIVDDYNWEKVRTGTQKALKKLNANIVSSVEIRTTEDNTHPPQNPVSAWHNGYYIAVIKKHE